MDRDTEQTSQDGGLNGRYQLRRREQIDNLLFTQKLHPFISERFFFLIDF